MAGACIHGFAPGTCLICQTLEQQPAGTAPKKATTAPKQSTVPVVASPNKSSPARTRSGPRVVPKEAPRTGSAPILKLVALAIAVVVAIVVAWTVLHVVFAILHILELVGVAVVAGYLGWAAGVHHGRRTARRD